MLGSFEILSAISLIDARCSKEWDPVQQDRKLLQSTTPRCESLSLEFSMHYGVSVSLIVIRNNFIAKRSLKVRFHRIWKPMQVIYSCASRLDVCDLSSDVTDLA